MLRRFIPIFLFFCVFLLTATPVGAVSTTIGPADPLSWHISQLKPGDTLLLKDGVYTNTLFVQVSGTAAQPITIKAEHDGKVIFDGQKNHEPVRITGKYLNIEGLESRNSNTSALFVSGTSNVTLKRVSAYNGNIGGNYHVWVVENSTNILIEDCVGGGTGRYIFLAYASSGVTWRRCFGRWHTHTGNLAPRSIFGIYGSENVTLENVIATHAIPSSSGLVQYAGVYITRNDEAGQYDPKNISIRGSIISNNWQLGVIGNVPEASNLQIDNTVFLENLGTPCITAFPENCRDFADGISFYLSPNGGVNHSTFVGNSNAINMNTTSNSLKNSLFVGNNVVVRGKSGFTHSNIGLWNNKSVGVFAANSTTKTVDPGFNTNIYGKGAYLFVPTASSYKRAGDGGSDIGANLLYQTINGTQTSIPLWPWPMEERITTEMLREVGTNVSPTWESNGGFWKTLSGVYTGTQATVPPTPVSTVKPTTIPTIRPTNTPTVRPSPTSAPICQGDFNADRVVDLSDYALFVRDFLKPVGGGKATDINKDGQVDLSDYSLFIKRFLKTCL